MRKKRKTRKKRRTRKMRRRVYSFKQSRTSARAPLPEEQRTWQIISSMMCRMRRAWA
jgi:hypothetical protein